MSLFAILRRSLRNVCFPYVKIYFNTAIAEYFQNYVNFINEILTRQQSVYNVIFGSVRVVIFAVEMQ